MKAKDTHTHIEAQTNKPAHTTLMVRIDWLIEKGTEGTEREGLLSAQTERPQVVSVG